MELDKLLNEVSEGVEKNLTLKNEQEAMKRAITDKVNDNYNTLFYPEVKKLWDFVCKISRETDIHVSLNTYGTIDYEAKYNRTSFMSIRTTKLDYDRRCNFITAKGNIWTIHEKDVKYAKDFSSWEGSIPYFCTEEATLKALDIAKKGFAEYFEKFSFLLKRQNESLSEEVHKLHDVLMSSSSVKKCEDGTVEINIGGKTYVGTLKEES